MLLTMTRMTQKGQQSKMHLKKVPSGQMDTLAG